MWAVSPMMMAASAEPITFIGAGSVANGAAIAPTNHGAQASDLILVCCPHESYSGGTTNFTLGGSGWSYTGYSWSAQEYRARFAWKALSDINDITTSNNNFGAFYAIYRGPTTAAIIVNQDVFSATTHTASFPIKNAACVALAVFGHQQNPVANLNPPTAWTDRFHAYMVSVFASDILENFTPPEGAHSAAFTGTAGDGNGHHLIGVELRA